MVAGPFFELVVAIALSVSTIKLAFPSWSSIPSHPLETIVGHSIICAELVCHAYPEMALAFHGVLWKVGYTLHPTSPSSASSIFPTWEALPDLMQKMATKFLPLAQCRDLLLVQVATSLVILQTSGL